MKLNHFTVLAAITVLVLGVMAAVASRTFALGSQIAGSPAKAALVHGQGAITQAKIAVQAPATVDPACGQDQAAGTDAATSATDTDNVDLQCGDQNAPDLTAAGSDAQGAVDPAGNPNVQDQSGDQGAPDTGAVTP